MLAALQAAGLNVSPHPDWETATNGSRDRTETVGITNHWDAISGWPGVSKYLSNNRFGGILYHIVIRSDGELHLLSQRYVWHAGKGSSQILATARAGGPVPDDQAGPDDTNGNPHFFGVCINYHPDDGMVPREQYDALVTTNRVLADHFDLNVGQVFRHMDWTTRKRDIDTINLAQFRADIGGDDGMITKWLTETGFRKLYQLGVVGGASEQAVVDYWIRDRAQRPESEHVDASSNIFVALAERGGTVDLTGYAKAGHDHDGDYVRDITVTK